MLGFADTCLSAGSLAEDSVEAPNVTGHVAGRFTLHRAFLAWSLPSPPSRPVRPAFPVSQLMKPGPVVRGVSTVGAEQQQ